MGIPLGVQPDIRSLVGMPGTEKVLQGPDSPILLVEAGDIVLVAAESADTQDSANARDYVVS